MSINKTYAVFGLGRYGVAVAEELVNSGAEVLAVDVDQENVDNAAKTIPVCKCVPRSSSVSEYRILTLSSLRWQAILKQALWL